jgi:porphobilinogen synthase
VNYCDIVHDLNLAEAARPIVILLSQANNRLIKLKRGWKVDFNLPIRPRRNRRTAIIRDMVAETELSVRNLVYPLFVSENKSQEIRAMPGQFRHDIDSLCRHIESSMNSGLSAFALFPALGDTGKSEHAEEALNPDGLIPRTLRRLKEVFPEIHLITDLALDPFTTHGHDGLMRDGEILNDETVSVLAQMATLHAKCGADWVAPSDMMDGRVGMIRRGLDESGFTGTGIMAYSAKYASAFYGPFRFALDSAPKSGDKKTYQMDPRNSIEALREVALDIAEGADVVMVKPALAYLDVIAKVKAVSQVPVAAYNVSGEYAMLKAAVQIGAIDERAAVLETLVSIRRAGADIIFTYFAGQAAQYLK